MLLRFRYVTFIIFSCQVTVRVCYLVTASHVFLKLVFSIYFLPEHAVTAASRPHITTSFLTPNGNCSPTSSVSLSWSSTIKALDPFPDRDRELMNAIEIDFVFLFQNAFR